MRELYVRKLATNRVILVSITQEISDNFMCVMVRQTIVLLDECQSKENAKQALRTMKETPTRVAGMKSLWPIGCRIVAIERRGSKTWKKAEIVH